MITDISNEMLPKLEVLFKIKKVHIWDYADGWLNGMQTDESVEEICELLEIDETELETILYEEASVKETRLLRAKAKKLDRLEKSSTYMFIKAFEQEIIDSINESN
jgi:hypothetical protein